MGLEILIPLAPFIMVLGIIWLVNNRKLEEKRIAATAEASSEKAAQYASRVTELEQRVQVLERIVTDRGYDIATQIEALRDQRKVDDQGTGTPLEIKQGEKAQ
ncbi:hypothetical protein [Erythrobacter sp. AP23]|uniref:hypothetical protein n=1 Tax=Erythrobacter sp. AP23 TaxID=499656 RepID=UPI00076D0243|nr:hypothetical protein [Erythrobacter sp. AP23]KWV94201.1 hypothetical protein ASS64_10240 [Erythrobacter sp. AP23]